MREDDNNVPRQSKAGSGNCDKSSKTAGDVNIGDEESKIPSNNSDKRTAATAVCAKHKPESSVPPSPSKQKQQKQPKQDQPKSPKKIQSSLPIVCDSPAKPSNDEDLLPIAAPNKEPKFSVGDHVDVVSRTWIGIDKPGGIGIVSKVTTANGAHAYDIKYSSRCTEEGVEEHFLSSRVRRRRSRASRPASNVPNQAGECNEQQQSQTASSGAGAKRKTKCDDDASSGVGEKKKKKRRKEEESNPRNAGKVHKSIIKGKTKGANAKKAKTDKEQQVVDLDFSKCINHKTRSCQGTVGGGRIRSAVVLVARKRQLLKWIFTMVQKGVDGH